MSEVEPIQFGKYLLHEKLGSGGMAEVYRATVAGPRGFEKVVAIKRILEPFAQDPDFTTMFIDEAQITVALSHPNIAQVFEFEQVDDVYYIAMEYIHGSALSAVIRAARKRKLPIPEPVVVYIGMEICKGLYAAHDARDAQGTSLGIIHRDVSPQNIHISYAGLVKILDFGVAKAATKLMMTAAGTIRGKLQYMAPEQVRARPLDHRADLYSLGLVIYKTLTGKHPFAGRSDIEIVNKLRKLEIPRPSSLRDDLSVQLDSAVMKALEVRIEDRFEDAKAMHSALASVLREVAPGFSWSDLKVFMGTLFDEKGVPHPVDEPSGRATSDAEVERPEISPMSPPPSPLLDSRPSQERHGEQEPPNVGGLATRALDLAADGLQVDSSSSLVPGSGTAALASSPLWARGPGGPGGLRGESPSAADAEEALDEQQLTETTLPSLSARAAFGEGSSGRGWALAGGALCAVLAVWAWAAIGHEPSSAPAQKKAPADRAALATLGSVDLISHPPGAEIFVDDERRLKAEGRPLVTPALLEGLPVGVHQLRLEIPGYVPWRGRFRAEASERDRVEASLDMTPGRIELSSSPTGATVLLDATERGTTPLTIEKLDRAIEHRLQVRLAGYQIHEERLLLEAERLVLSVVLKPALAPARKRKASLQRSAAATASRPGRISVNAIPWARLWVDGVDTGKTTPVRNLELTPGKHRIRLVNAGQGLSEEVTIRVRPGRAETVSVDFRKRK